MYKVIIVEDDPMVAALNRQYLEREKDFSVSGAFRNGTEALEYLRRHPVDLAILDYYMPVMDGKELILTCLDERIRLDFIMITAANDAGEIAEIVHLGVVDYLIKPFTGARFRNALHRYLEMKGRFRTSGQLTQEEVDRILSRNDPSAQEEILEKGLQKQTLDTITGFLRGSPDREYTSKEVANQVRLSRVTVRRYMNYLLKNGEIISRIDYTTGGRPAILYRMK